MLDNLVGHSNLQGNNHTNAKEKMEEMSPRKILLLIIVVAVLAALLWIYLARRPTERMGAARPIGTPVEIEAPLGLPPVLIPADNPPLRLDNV